MTGHDLFLWRTRFAIVLATVGLGGRLGAADVAETGSSAGSRGRPNILFAISDDQSYPHASAYGYKAVRTPAFDRIAREGVLFRNAFAPSPGCSPSRAAILTGRYPWQNEHAGTHASSFSNKFAVYPDLLEQAGYFVGYTGKGWGPGNYQAGGFKRNPAGAAFARRKMAAPPGVSSTDYAANFEDFLEKRPRDKPFCFWYGGHESHRQFEPGIGLKHGGKLEDVTVPAFLPDTQVVRSDILDYCFEIEWFDQHLARMIDLLEKRGELDNTIIVVTSDNGMPFPRAKANLYEYGFHVPLAIRWADRAPGGRVVDDSVSLIDLMPTYLEAAGVRHPGTLPMSGRSLLNVLESRQQGLVDPDRTAVYSARERRSSSRWNNLSYPQRCIRTESYLYIRNFRPRRWPAGAPQKYEPVRGGDGELKLGPMHGGYHDVDSSPTLDLLIRSADDPRLGRYLQLAVQRRPAEELFDVSTDPSCLVNVAEDPAYREIKLNLSRQLEDYLRRTGDPRVLDGGEIFESYRRYSPLREFPKPDWAE